MQLRATDDIETAMRRNCAIPSGLRMCLRSPQQKIRLRYQTTFAPALQDGALKVVSKHTSLTSGILDLYG